MVVQIRGSWGKRGSHQRGALTGVKGGIFCGLMSLVSVGCLSAGVQSTGAVLPQASTQFDDDVLQVSVNHDCSGGRCQGFETTFKNLSDEPLEVVVGESRITRAQESYALVRVGADKASAQGFLVSPKQTRSEKFVVQHPQGPASYAMPTAVWCSVKIAKPNCPTVAKAQGECAGFARYYHETYTKASGWISLNFVYKQGGRKAVISSLAPQFLGQAPAVQLSENSEAPFWLGSGGDAVFYKISCDNDCVCRELNKKRNFFKDDKFDPVNKKSDK